MLEQVQARLAYLEAVGLGYLTLDRTLRTLSGGEARRVALTSALGSSLVNMLYVLDEPSIGLHPRDIHQLLGAIKQLRDRGNTVVVVEHEEAIIRAADQVIEIGPGAGERGGKVVFQGTPAEMEQSPDSLTGDYLAGRRGFGSNGRRRAPNHGWIRLAGARGNNLKNVTVEFPLGVLCLVTGVSGSGKSTLVQDTLYPALCRRLRKDAPKPYPHDDVFGDGQLDDVIMVDQSPIGRSPRSNPVTYLKAFDEIRAVFADTVEARTRGYNAGHFSFNVDGGRCNACHGDGYIADRHAVPGRRLHALPAVQRHPLPRRDPRRHLPRPEHRRRAGNDRPRGVHLLPRPAEGAGPAEAADRRGAGLRAARPAGQHALRRRGPAAETGRLHEHAPSAAAACSSSTSRPPGCTSPTSCNCWIASTPCWPWAIR